MKNKYTPKYFKENLPEWKRIKDPITNRLFYRQLSFVTASIAANLGISANTVSYFSILIAIASCALLIIPNRICNILGAIGVSIWLLSDCTDGNIARSVKKQPFGTFADSISSYILIGFLCTALGINTYFNGGILIDKNCIWIVLIGSLASSGDTLMRLIYQKYKSTERDLVEDGMLELEYDKRTDETQTNSLIVRIESDFGISGIVPILVLISVILKAVDLAVIYCFLYYFLSAVAVIIKYIIKAIKKTKKIENKNK